RIAEGEHLLLDDVGRLAAGLVEERGVLEDRGADLFVAEPVETGARGILEPPPPGGLLGQDVMRALGRAEVHGGGILADRRGSLNGFSCLTAPIAAVTVFPMTVARVTEITASSKK